MEENLDLIACVVGLDPPFFVLSIVVVVSGLSPVVFATKCRATHGK